MHGSLEVPPVIIRVSRLKSSLMLVVSIVLVVWGVVVLINGASLQRSVVIYIGVIAFGLAVPVYAWQTFRPNNITMTRDGIAWNTMFRTKRWKWREIQNFRPGGPGPRRVAGIVVFDFTEDRDTPVTRPERTVESRAGYDGSFGGGWELNAVKLADLLNKARARWLD